jgi:hypothetical protein
MRPGVRSDLVALGVHTLDDIDELGRDINLTLVDVVSSDEESSLRVIAGEDIQDVVGEDLLWAIIVGQRNGTGCDAVVNARAAVLNISNLGPSN